MHKHNLEILPISEIITELNSAFGKMPVVTKHCTQALNLLIFNLRCSHFSETHLKDILVVVLRGFSSNDMYLKNYIFITLMEIQNYSEESGIISINSILKEIDSKVSSKNVCLKNLGMRSLFRSLPELMRMDFERYVKQSLLNADSKDNSVVISSEYFKTMKIETSMSGNIEDYHLSFFNNLPINKYSVLLEIKKIISGNGHISEVVKYLKGGVDDVVFLEACKCLLIFPQEVSATYVDRALDTLRLFMHSNEVKQFSAIKIISKLSINFPNKVAKINKEIEDAVHSTNQSVSMLAILVLLKTGNEESVRKLAKKIEPFLSTMSNSYKIMAIDTMEKLAKSRKDEFVSFLRNALIQKGDLSFKKYILQKFDRVLNTMDDTGENALESDEESEHILKHDTISFLCNYIEDPEYYQLSMDILGIFGKHLRNLKDLVHVYNRLIIDNSHVKNCAIQTLFDLDHKFNTLEAIPQIDGSIFKEFLMKNRNVRRGEFKMDELGELKEEVLKYIKYKEPEIIKESDFIKECRSIILTEKKSDFQISLVKKIFVDKVILAFTIKNRLENVKIISGLLTVVGDESEYKMDVNSDGVYDLEVNAKEGETYNGVFEYEIGMEEDPEDTENDSISLNPFEFTIFDFSRPMDISEIPSLTKAVELSLNSTVEESISQIVSMVNLHLIADKNYFRLSGKYNGECIVLKGTLKYNKYTIVKMEIASTDKAVLETAAAVFE